MNSKQNTLRITEFKGLNKSANPHNIDDAEFTDMINVELSENRTLQSRKGFTKVVSDINAPYVRSLHKVDWDDNTSTLYAVHGAGFTKVNETAGTESNVGVILGGLQPQFQRWHDKLLILAPNGLPGLYWMNSAETYKPAVYPQFRVASNWPTMVSGSAGGSLADTTHYQYNVSFLLGPDYRDGETAGALPGEGKTWTHDYPPPIGWHDTPGDYAGQTTTSANRTLTSSTMTFDGSLNGFSVTAIRLFRRTAKYISSDPYAYEGDNAYWAEDTPWVLLDEAYIAKDVALNTYGLQSTTTNVITFVNGTYNSTNDSASITFGFTDDGTAIYNAGVMPLSDKYVTNPQAKYMARAGNRVFLGNIIGSDPRDKKTVRFTYTGYIDTNATVEEIPNFHYAYPMLIFGPYSWFYCDHEDTDDEITGMYGYRNNLVIFTGKCTFMWQEGMRDPIKISNDVGCIAHHTIREFEGRLIWLSANGVMMLDGNKLTNLTQDKANSFIDGISKAYSFRATAAIFNRRYYIAAPFTGGVDNAYVLVYDFDLKEWFQRTYRITSTANFYIDYFYKYSDGSQETLYAGGHSNSATTPSFIVKIDNGWDDGGATIQCTLKTKYYDFGAPDIVKDFRAFNVDMTNFNGTCNIDMYLDNINEAFYTFAHTGSSSGFLVNDNTRGYVNVNYIVNFSDEMLAFSWPMGKHASRCQYALRFDAGASQTSIHAISFDWRVVRKLQRKYGGT